MVAFYSVGFSSAHFDGLVTCQKLLADACQNSVNIEGAFNQENKRTNEIYCLTEGRLPEGISFYDFLSKVRQHQLQFGLEEIKI